MTTTRGSMRPAERRRFLATVGRRSTTQGLVRPGGRGLPRRGAAVRPGPGRLPQPVRAEHHPARRPAPVRAYIEELMPAVLSGAVQPGKVFDVTIGLDQAPDGYAAMDRREALKVLIRP